MDNISQYIFQERVSNLQNELDRIINFIRHCDSKVSIMLGVNGIILTIIFTNNNLSEVIIFFSKIYLKSHWLTYFQILSALCYFIGIFTLVDSLIAKLGNKAQGSIAESLLYFRTIAENSSFDKFKNRYKSQSDENYIIDYLSEIYINSLICTKKFKSFNRGSWLLAFGWTGMILTICSYLLFK